MHVLSHQYTSTPSLMSFSLHTTFIYFINILLAFVFFVFLSNKHKQNKCNVLDCDSVVALITLYNDFHNKEIISRAILTHIVQFLEIW